jgi:hypothetical protein
MCILLETIWFTRLSAFCSIITSNMNQECCVFYYVDYRCLFFCTFSFDHCVVCSSSIYGFWLPLWYLLVIVLSVLLRYTILITPLVSFGHCVVCSSSIYGFWLPLWYLLVIVLSVLLRYTDSDYSFGIFWPLCCLFFFDIWILITPLVSFGHYVVCSSSIYGFWLLLWYLQTLLEVCFVSSTDDRFVFTTIYVLYWSIIYDL